MADKNPIEVMIDLETLSARSNAAIISIGAIKFDNEGLHDRLHMNICFNDANLPGFHIDGKAVGFWFKASQPARDALSPFNGMSLRRALQKLADFVKYETGGIWGNGSDFDNVILTNAYDSLNMEMPWQYKRNRCYRTIRELCPEVEFQRIGEAHNCMDDAISQANHAIKILRKIGKYPAEIQSSMFDPVGEINVPYLPDTGAIGS